jgi:hypothetical protein
MRSISWNNVALIQNLKPPWPTILLHGSPNMVERTEGGTSILPAYSIVRVPTKPDPRDKIFGLLGIATEGSAGYVRADYSKGAREIYTSVTRQLLIGDQHPELLGAAQFVEERVNLPSQVADWSIGLVCFDGSASYFAPGESRSSIENIGDPNKLCIRGILVDVIKETLGADRDFQHVSTAEYISDMVHELHLLEQYPHTAELRNYALFKTMTTELSPLSRRTDRSSGIHAVAFDEANFGRKYVLIPGQGNKHQISAESVVRDISSPPSGDTWG